MSDMRDKWRAAPVRPSISIPFALAALMWPACAAAYTAALDASAHVLANAALASLAAAMALLAVGLKAGARRAGMTAAALLVGCALGCAEGAWVHHVSEACDGKELDVRLVCVEDARTTAFGARCLARASVVGMPPFLVAVQCDDGADLLGGEVVESRLTLKAVAPERASYSFQQGTLLKASLPASAAGSHAASGPLVALRRRAIAALATGGNEASLLAAVVCGYRQGVRGTALYAAFQTCGLAHLVAVSGAHLVIVTGLIAALLKRLCVPRRASVAVLIAVMASYYIVAGSPVSALRACVMSSVSILAVVGRRRPSALNGLGLAVIGLVAVQPHVAVSASFTLSALSTAGIVLFAPLVQHLIERALPFRAPYLAESVGLTLSASLLAQPYACSLFAQLPLMSPIANMVAGPLFAPVCTLGLLDCLAGTGALPFSGFLHFVALAAARALCLVVGILAGVPHASVPVQVDTLPALASSVLLAIALWVAWDRASPAKIAAVACVPLIALGLHAAFAAQADEIVMLDIGQGDAILVRSRGQSLLVDTGNQDTQLLRQLAANAVVHLDSVLVTHADDDHRGSLDALEKTVTVDRVLVASGIAADGDEACRALMADARATAPSVVELSWGDVFTVGAFTMRVIWPHALSEHAGNADSLCLLATYDGDGDGRVDFRALFTGDAEIDQVQRMIDEGSVGDVDILKVGHHGSRNGMTLEQARVIAPEIALISVGADNRYGHPTQETLDILDEVGGRVFRTDEDGCVRCRLTADEVAVTCAPFG